MSLNYQTCDDCGTHGFAERGPLGVLCNTCRWRRRDEYRAAVGKDSNPPCQAVAAPGKSNICDCSGCTWDIRTMAYWPAGHEIPPPPPPPAAPSRTTLPPTRSDTVCGKNRYGTAEAALNALEAHSEARGFRAAAVVSHPLCPGYFHVVPLSKAGQYAEVHYG